MEDDLVERLPSGEYTVYAPQTAYAHMAMGGNENEAEDGGTFALYVLYI